MFPKSVMVREAKHMNDKLTDQLKKKKISVNKFNKAVLRWEGKTQEELFSYLKNQGFIYRFDENLKNGKIRKWWILPEYSKTKGDLTPLLKIHAK